MNDASQNAESADSRHSIATWLRVDRHVVEGLHLLRLASDPSWIVRKDLHVYLDATTHAAQHFSVDIDVGLLEATLPESLGQRRLGDDPVWVPILRMPRINTLSQRVGTVVDGNQQTMPVMRAADVRFRLAAALSWIYLSGSFRAPTLPGLGEVARLQLAVQERMYDFLTSGVSDAFTFTHDADATRPQGLLRRALNELDVLATPRPFYTDQKRDPQHRFTHITTSEERNMTGDDPHRLRHVPFRGGLSETMEFCRSSHLTVIGMTADSSRHIDCDLLPAPLDIKLHDQRRRARTILGFDFTDTHAIHRSRASQALLWATSPARRLLHRPSAFYFQLPVPEVSALDNSHVTVHAHEDVAIHPAVLYHDHVVDLGGPGHRGRPDWSAQAYRVQEWLSLMTVELKKEAVTDQHAALRAVTRTELARAARLLEERRSRLELVARRVGAPSDEDIRQLPTVAETEAARETAEELLSVLDRDNRSSDKASARFTGASTSRRSAANPMDLLAALASNLDTTPHLELTPDDDPRENVAHFHTAVAPSLTPRDRDRRPVIHGILRASKGGVQGYLKMVAFTCVINFVLAAAGLGLVTASASRGFEYNVEALVAVLVVVPGVSAALLGRFPGGSIRYRVLERPVRLAFFSIVAPASHAVLLATYLDPTRLIASNDVIGEFVVPFLLPPLVLGFTVAALASGEYIRQSRPFKLSRTATGRVRLDRFTALGTDRADKTGNAGPTDGASWHRARVDTRLVLDLSSAALFQAERPSRRFMTWLDVAEDTPGDFLHVVDALEDTADPNRGFRDDAIQTSRESSASTEVDNQPTRPHDRTDRFRRAMTSAFWRQVPDTMIESLDRFTGYLEGEPTRPRLTIEAAAAHTVSGGSSIVSIISGERYKLDGTGEVTEDSIRESLVEQFERRRGPNRNNLNLVVEEINEDRNYFLYSAPRFVDAVVAVPASHRPQLAWLIYHLWGLDRLFRISYLHCPTGVVQIDGDQGRLEPYALLKVGLSFDRHLEPYIPASLLQVCRLTQRIEGARLRTHDRRFYPDAIRELATRQEPYRLVAASAAGPGTPAMVRHLFKQLYPETKWCDPDWFTNDAACRFFSGSTLTAGGYVSRTFQFQIHPDHNRELQSKDRLPLDETDPDPAFTWHLRQPTQPSGSASTPKATGSEFVIWVRWQLVGEDLSRLLESIDLWAATTSEAEGLSPNSVKLNLQYLNNRVNELGQINGKAQYKAFVTARHPIADSREHLFMRLRRSLYGHLNSTQKERLLPDNCYVQVSDEEPRRPALSYRRDSEFNSY